MALQFDGPEDLTSYARTYAPQPRRRRRVALPGFDLLDQDAQTEAVNLGIVDDPQTSVRNERAQRDALAEAGAQDFVETKGRNKGRVLPEYTSLFSAESDSELTGAMGAVRRVQAAQREAAEKKQLAELRAQRSQLGSLRTYHDQALRAFAKSDGAELDFQPDGQGGEIDVGSLAGQIAQLEKKAGEKVGIIRGALTPGISAGDPTAGAGEAEAQLGDLRKKYQLLVEKRNRIKAERDRVASTYAKVNTDFAGVMSKKLGLAGAPVDDQLDTPEQPQPSGELSTRGSVKDAATPDMSPTGLPTPQALIRMKRTADELQSTLDDANGNLAAPVVDRLTKQVKILREKFDTGFAQQDPVFQKRISDITRNPTLAENIGGAAVNVVRGAGNALTDTGEFLARNALRAVPGMGDKEQAQKFVADYSQAMREEADSWNAWIPPEVRQQVDSGFWTGDVPQGAGSTLAFMAPTSAVAGLGRAVGLGQKAIGRLVVASVAGTGAAAEGNSFRREAEQKLRPQLEAGQITPEEYTRSLGMAELFGGVLGTTEALPVSRFARRVAEVPAGRTFLRSLLDVAGRGGANGIRGFMRGPGKKMMVDILSEGFEEAGQEFAQNISEDLYAKATFDPEREVGAGASRAGAAGGISGLLFSALTSALGAPQIARRYKSLNEAVQRGAEERRKGPDETGTAPAGGPESPTPTPAGDAAQTPPAADAGPANDEVQVDEELAAELAQNRPRRAEMAPRAEEMAPEPAQTEAQPAEQAPAMDAENAPAEGDSVTGTAVPIDRTEDQLKAQRADNEITDERLAEMPDEDLALRIGALRNVIERLPESDPARATAAETNDRFTAEMERRQAERMTNVTPQAEEERPALTEPVSDGQEEMPTDTAQAAVGGGQAAADANVPPAAAPDRQEPELSEPAKGTAPSAADAPAADVREPKPPAIERGKNSPAAFAAVVNSIRDPNNRQPDRELKTAKFLTDFSRRLSKAAPDAFRNMEVRTLNAQEWSEDDALSSRTPDSAAAFDTDTNTLYLHTERLTPENLASAIVHEAGHFAEKFYLGDEFTQGEWEKLTGFQRMQAAREYSKGASLGDLTNDTRARREWVAMQFARVVRGDTEGIAPRIKAKLEQFLRDIREVVSKWVGNGELTTKALDAKILEMLDYAPKEKAPAVAKPAENIPQNIPAKGGRAISPELQKLGEDLFGTPPAQPSKAYAQKFAPDKVENANRFVAMIVREHPDIRSRKALAEFIDEKFPKARPYSESIFRILGGFADVDESGTFDDHYKPEAAEEPAKVKRSYGENVTDAANQIRIRLNASGGGPMDWRELFAITDKAFGGTQADGAYTVKDAYDALETAVNLWLVRSQSSVTTRFPSKAAGDLIRSYAKMLEKVPTQTKRTEEQIAAQQFSTPPTLAYAANWVANLNEDDIYLEPSGGTGGLAAFGRIAGVKKVLANELSPRRAEILKASGIADDVTTHNAEQLHALTNPKFEKGGRPTVVVMNPPFSNGAESGKRGDTMVGAKHVEEALKTLAPGGRLVAIVGEGMAFGKPTFTQWWKRIGETYAVRANVGVNGEKYRKYGTTFGNQLLVIDKVAPDGRPVVQGSVEKVEELPQLLDQVRDDRPAASPGEQNAPAQSGGIAAPAQSGGTGVGNANPRPAADVSRPGRPKAPRGDGVRGKLPKEPGGAGSSVESPDAGRTPVGDAGAGGGTGGGRASAGTQSGPELSLTKPAARVPTGPANDDDVFSEYSPAKVNIPGAKPHPTPLVESAAMAAVQPPDPSYVPNLPKELVTSGKLSDAQLENVVYAGQAHQKFLNDGSRRGFFIGDGTGVGKGRQIAAIILDNMRQGRKRAVWISKTGTLADDARRDMRDIGMDDSLLAPINDIAKAKTGTVNLKQGIVFSTYTSLSKNHDGLDQNGKLRAEVDNKSRLQQIVDWAGPDFDGVIAFDEAHLAGNAVAIKGKRGMKKPSNTGLAVVDLQKLLPKARIVYVSATGATEVANLSYAERLGIWGPGTPFPSKLNFIDEISSGGVSAMEIVARDLKAMGSYLARTLSFKGVKFDADSVQQKLTPEQTAIYDQIAEAWQIVLQNIDAAMDVTGLANNGRARGNAIGKFWGANQRFFNQLLTAMELPAVIADMRKELASGNAPVLQLVNTNEATQNREIARVTTEENPDLDELDLSPRDILLQYVNTGFPTTKFHEVADPNNPDRTTWVPLLDADGNPVQDPDAVAKKNDLLLRLATLAVPENPLEQILNEFGSDRVAEVTGRERRVVNKEVDGQTKRVLEQNRSEATRKVEAGEFQDGLRDILIFSGAGGTGFSYHASRKAKNQKLRVHYLVQAGWRADAALQGFGRTHRSDQAQAPFYKLASTDIQGHKRFISTIARRLAQLGALTAGERKSTGQGLFSEEDNLESQYANDALTRFWFDLYADAIPGHKFDELTRRMGYVHTRDGESINQLIDAETGGLNKDDLPTVQQFLNRLLSLGVKEQNGVFGEFMARMMNRIQAAKSDGSYDPGVQTYRAAEINKTADDVVFKLPESSAETRIVEVEVVNPRAFNTFATVANRDVVRWVKNAKSGHVYGLQDVKHNLTLASGEVVPTFRRIGTHSEDFHPQRDFAGESYQTLTDDQAEAAWNEEIARTDKNTRKTEHFIVGAFLPIWDRIKLDSPKIYRFTTSDGETMLGARIPPKQVEGVRKRLGAKSTTTPEKAFRAVLDDGASYELANGWKVRRVMVSGQPRIEITNYGYADAREIRDYIGGFVEYIAYKPRMFLPTDEAKGVAAFKRMLDKSPIADSGDGVVGSPVDEPLSPPKNAQVPGNPGYRYRSHPDSLILAGIETARQVYKTRQNEGDDAAAKAIIKEVGEAMAAELSMDEQADLPGAVKTAIAVNLQHTLNRRRFDKNLSTEDRTRASRMAARLAEVKAEQFTDMGQAIQFLARLNHYSEDGVLQAATAAVRQRQEKMIGEPGKKVIDGATDALNKENERAIEQATEDLNRALKAVRVSKSIWKRYQAAAARRWLKRIESNLGQLEQTNPPLAEFTNRLIREIQNKIDQALPPGKKPAPRPPMEIIGEAINNREKYQEAWQAARDALEEKYAEQPEVLEKLDEAMMGLLDKPFSDKTLDRAIRQAHTEMGVTVRDIARMHYRQADALGQTLAEKLAAQANLKPEDAERLARTIRDRMAEVTRKAKQAVLKRLADRAPTGGPARRIASMADKLINLSNAGALHQADLFDAVARELKLPRLTDEQAQSLREMAQKIQDTPEGFQRDRVITDLLAELRKVRGIGPVDVATAVYYSHILSGYTTQIVNGISTALNTLADLTALIVRHPTTAGQAARGLMDGARTGFVQAMSILDTGYAHAHFDEKLPEVSPVIEALSKDKDRSAALRAYSNLLRYVGRAMKATDAVFFHSASEAYQRVAAARLAAQAEGKVDRATLNRNIRDMLGMSPADFEAARAQAKAEGLKGLDYELRVGEIIRQKRDPQLQTAGVEFGRMATFNNEPRGYLGVVAKAVSQASNNVPALKLFVPFTNIVSNVTNASLNYSPLGISRALTGYGGENAPAPEERDTLLIKGIAGTLGLLALLAYGGGDDDEPWITANGPSDSGARNQLRNTGWKPHTIKVGDAFVSYLETPFALPLALIGNYLDLTRYDKLTEKDATDKALSVAGGLGETVFNMSFLQGLGTLMDVIRGQPGAVKNFAKQAVAGATVPNLVRQVDRTVDPTIYDSPGLTGVLTSGLPGVRQMEQPRLNVVGKPIESQPLERFGRIAANDPLWSTLAAKKAFIPEASRQTKLGKTALTPEQYRRYVEVSGQAIERRLRSALPAIQRMTEEQADKFVQRVTREERERAKPGLRRV